MTNGRNSSVGVLPCENEKLTVSQSVNRSRITPRFRKTHLSRVRCDIDGFTLIEMVATVALIVTLFSMATGSFSYYFASKGLETTAGEITTEIREAQAMALATGNTYRLDFSGNDSYLLQRRQGGTWVTELGPIKLEGNTRISGTYPPSFGGDRYLECYARGTCEDGQIVLDTSFGQSRTLQVTGETVNIETL